MPVLQQAIQIQRARLLIGSDWIEGESTFEVPDKMTGEPIGLVDCASQAQVASAVDSARAAFEKSVLEPYDRYWILTRAAELIGQHRQEFAALIAAEAGFPLSDGDNEVNRAIETFLISAEEGKRLTGEMVPIQGAPGNAHRLAF